MSNLLKQCYVVSSGTGTRIINSNDGVRQKLKELQQEQAPEQVDVSAEDGQENAPAGFSQGIQAKTVQIDVEALRREAEERVNDVENAQGYARPGRILPRQKKMQNVSVGKRKKKPVPCMKNKRNSDTKRVPDAGKKN